MFFEHTFAIWALILSFTQVRELFIGSYFLSKGVTYFVEVEETRRRQLLHCLYIVNLDFSSIPPSYLVNQQY
jgi:hypothetical protein